MRLGPRGWQLSLRRLEGGYTGIIALPEHAAHLLVRTLESWDSRPGELAPDPYALVRQRTYNFVAGLWCTTGATLLSVAFDRVRA